MLTVRGVSKNYGSVQALQDISFTLEKGEVVGLLGANGAGKSTTMNIISGYFPPTGGSVTLAGHDVTKEPFEYKQNLGYLPENPPLYLDMTIREQLRFVCSAKRIPRREWPAEIERVTRLSSIHDVQHRLIRTMSKGYRQRIGLAQALAGRPGLLILDEPTAGLDPQQIIEIRDLIETLKEEHTVIISSHILSEIASVSTRILIMHQGRIMADRPVGELLDSSQEAPVLFLRVYGKGDTAERLVARLPGVQKVVTRDSIEPGCLDCDIHLTGGVDIRKELTTILAKHNLPVMAMALKTRTLEDIFIEIIRRG
jgi:ABC-type multidrug transport system ATPase subunit